jgi:hypothetical protein
VNIGEIVGEKKSRLLIIDFTSAEENLLQLPGSSERMNWERLTIIPAMS